MRDLTKTETHVTQASVLTALIVLAIILLIV